MNPLILVSLELHRLAPGLTSRLRREQGQTMAEYAILIAVIALVVILAATAFGKSISSVFSSLSKSI